MQDLGAPWEEISNIKVVIADSSNQKDSTSFDLIVEDCLTGIGEVLSPDFNIYPVPTDGMLYLDLNKDFHEILIEIFDALSREIYIKRFKETSSVKINVPGPPGIYYMHVNTDNSKSIYKILKE